MTLEAIKPGHGGAHTPTVTVHHFTAEEIEERRKEVKEDNGK